MSAQYGNSAGSTVNLVTKSGTNAWHGSGWEYIRNNVSRCQRVLCESSRDVQTSAAFQSVRRYVGGPIIKDKLFFFLSLQGDRYHSDGNPVNVLQDSPLWEQAVAGANRPGSLNSTASMLYKQLRHSNPGTAVPTSPMDCYVWTNVNGNPNCNGTITPDYSGLPYLDNGISWAGHPAFTLCNTRRSPTSLALFRLTSLP